MIPHDGGDLFPFSQKARQPPTLVAALVWTPHTPELSTNDTPKVKVDVTQNADRKQPVKETTVC